ncbi:MAG: GNAT family N-acetyltransferase, partial [Gammaproteobacteria bacterium]|nr:GNAT family N-acetyltransferase [Gammaproteobacteria bacterium]
MHIVVHDHLTEIDAVQWNAMLAGNNPFMRHEFLSGLERCGCVCESTGWQPAHIAIYPDSNRTTLLGAMPCYIKNHSYGEYIFDWAWADAHHRHGLNYYPKLSNAVPFTPASGERWLISGKADRPAVFEALINRALTLVRELELSSFHSLFLGKDQFDALADKDFSQRHSTQFHWRNRGFQCFEDFLGRMSSKKRKNIKRERRRIRESGVSYRWLSG